MAETVTNGRFLVMALDLDDSVQVFGAYPSAESARKAITELEKIHWRFSKWRVEAWEPAFESGR